MMEWVALVILILCSLAGFVANFFTGVGTLIILAGAVLYAAMTGFAVLSLKTLLVLGLLYACGEAVEFVSTMAGTKRFGGSNRAAVGGVIGGMAGAALGVLALGVGAFLGLLLGLFLGAALTELAVKQDPRQALKAGVGSLLGRIASIAVKTVIALTMLLIIGIRVLGQWGGPPGP